MYLKNINFQIGLKNEEYILKAVKAIYFILVIGTLVADIVLSYVFLFTKSYDTWPNGQIYYRYAGEFTDEEKDIIRLTMDIWEYSTDYSIKFIHTKKEYDKVCYIVKGYKNKIESSFATVGYNTELNYCFLDDSALDNMAIIGHELGHVIGLVHENQRPDRDDYIIVNYKNIEKNCESFLDKNFAREFIYNYKLFPYDYKSIMHYSSFVFSKDWKSPVLMTKDNKYIPVNGISKIDSKKVIFMYRGKL